MAAGGAPNLEFLKSVDRAAAHIIGVDGGADALAAAGITPDAVMGDMDSARGDFKNKIILPDENQSDLEKSIVYLLAGGVEIFTIYGALGGARLDHHIANLDLLTKYAPRCRIRLVAENGAMIDGLSPENTSPHGLDFPVQPGSKIGVLPYGGTATVTLRGTAYDLNKTEIQPGTCGVGNTATGDKVHIQIHKGLVRLIRDGAGK